MGLDELMKSRLPLNRKERFYTGTVFPAIVCADDFKYFGRFLKIVGHDNEVIDFRPQHTNVQFFTEYNLFESSYVTSRYAEFYSNTKGTRETPDILIFIDGAEPLLIAIEAKMYEAISRSELLKQMNRQEGEVLRRLTVKWPQLRTVHLALLPSSVAQGFGTLGPGLHASSNRTMITWETIHNVFEDVQSAQYFLRVLKFVLSNHKALKSRRNAQSRQPGDYIVQNFGNGAFPYQTMGRDKGMRGVAEDIKNGTWRERAYYLSISPTPRNLNWFPIPQFIDLVKVENEDNSELL